MSDNRVAKARTEKDVTWSSLSQGYRCIHCGQPAMVFGDGTVVCATMAGGEECQTADELEAELRDCASEGHHSYAVMGPDQ